MKESEIYELKDFTIEQSTEPAFGVPCNTWARDQALLVKWNVYTFK